MHTFVRKICTLFKPVAMSPKNQAKRHRAQGWITKNESVHILTSYLNTQIYAWALWELTFCVYPLLLNSFVLCENIYAAAPSSVEYLWYRLVGKSVMMFMKYININFFPMNLCILIVIC